MFALSAALIVVAYQPALLSGSQLWRPRTGFESRVEPVRLLRGRT